jgi:hypothetical protein
MFMLENMKIAVSLNNFSIYNQLFRHHFKIICFNLSEIHQLRVVI